MQFIYHEDAGKETLELLGEKFRHIFGSRRARREQIFLFRNLHDEMLYSYLVVNIDRKSAHFSLQTSTHTPRKKYKKLHLFWCIIDPKSIEKALPFLNEMELTSITFVHCNRSQKNLKLDLDRWMRILHESSEQCGRIDTIKIEEMILLDELLLRHDDVAVLDFGGSESFGAIDKVLVGCEGGFDEVEREKFASYKKISFGTDTILKSESAAIALVAKML